MFATALAWAQAQAAGSQARGLADAYLSGALRVTHDGRTVEYRSSADLRGAISALYSASISTTLRRPAMTIARLGDGY
jgi:hypothetical protein